jgi:hypothetical protein
MVSTRTGRTSGAGASCARWHPDTSASAATAKKVTDRGKRTHRRLASFSGTERLPVDDTAIFGDPARARNGTK